ncbi:MAG TPA: hypothetical protein DCM38_02085 [Gammaproteobacteria bacterium]|nr:hypothetical protein [Gammaproteobacteria bacterium]
MTLTLEIPQVSLDHIPLGYKKKLEERAILQIYEDGYISREEFAQISLTNFQGFNQFAISSNRKTVTTELYQKRKRYFSQMEKGTGEWNNILQNVISSRVDKEEPPILD